MRVHAVRISPAMWKRLKAVQVEINRSRARKLTISSVLRALLERGLNDPGNALEFGARTYRPEGARLAREHRRAAAAAERDATELHRAASVLIDRLLLMPAEFAAEIGGDRREAEAFYHCGALPEGDVLPFVTRIKDWISTRTNEKPHEAKA